MKKITGLIFAIAGVSIFAAADFSVFAEPFLVREQEGAFQDTDEDQDAVTTDNLPAGEETSADTTSLDDVPDQDTQDKEHSIAGKAAQDDDQLRDSAAVSSGNVPAAWAGSPTIGNVKALVVRIGFEDYTLDEEKHDCLTVQEIRDYFVGTNAREYPYESLSGYYARSSYGDFKIYPGQILDYTAPGKRADYTSKSGDKKELALVNDALQAVDEAVDLSEYDADGDGYADLVYFVYAGPDEDWGSSWWPHCKAENSGFLSLDDTGVRKYVITGSASKQIVIHESGHMLGLPDYYLYVDGPHEDIGVTDMMNDNYGDHNGFSKWTLGWLSDEDIVFIDKAAKDSTISLTPIDSNDKNGKKLAVIAPDNKKDIHSEYLLVEYVSGSGNMSKLEMGEAYQEGFRVFHVSAQTDDEVFDYLRSNNYGDEEILIKALGNNKVFKEGDEITPYSSPSTELYSGYSGFTISDFKTGDNPSFKVSYSEKENIHTEPGFSIIEENVSNMLETTLKSDMSLTLAGKNVPGDMVRIEKDGKKYPLYIKEDEFDETCFFLQYRQLTEPLDPDTEYTLVLPAGLFAYDDGEPVKEKRLTVKTGSFTKLTDISKEDESRDVLIKRTGLFSYEGKKAAYLTQTGNVTDEGMEFEFTLYENGKSSREAAFMIPVHETVESVQRMEMVAAENGVYVLSIQTADSTYLVKLNAKGEKLGLVKIDDLVETVKVGSIVKAVSTEPEEPLGEVTIGEGTNTGNIWTVDFEKAPRVVSYRYDAYVANGIFDINGETYGLPDYDEKQNIYYVNIFDKNDRFIRKVRLSANIPIAFCMDGDRIISAGICIDPDEKGGFLEAEIFDLTGRLLSEKILSSDYYQFMYLAGVKLQPAGWGYTFSFRYTGNTYSANSAMYFLSKDFAQMGYLALPAGSDVLPYNDRAVVVWEDYGYSTLAWTEVSFTGLKPVNDDKGSEDKKEKGTGDKKEKDGAGSGTGLKYVTDTKGDDKDPEDGSGREKQNAAGDFETKKADTSRGTATGDRGIIPWIITGSAAGGGLAGALFYINRKRKSDGM